MCAHLQSTGGGAFAALFVLVLAPSVAVATPVTVQSVGWQFYQGGVAAQDPFDFEVVQDFFSNQPTSTVDVTVGGANFRSIASILNTTVNDIDLFSYTSFVSLRAEASVDAGSPQGSAEAFAGLSLFAIEFEITGVPQFYFGNRTISGIDDEYTFGDLLPAGTYSYFFSAPFQLDVQAVAGPGQSTFDETSIELRFEFSPIPTPGAAALGIPALLAFARRRRRDR